MPKSKSLLCICLTVILAITTIVTAQKLSGTYVPDGQCVPSDTCCCSTGPATITSSDDNTKINFAAAVDGGKGCQNFKQLSAAFDYVDQYTGVWTVPVYNMKYQAKASSDYKTVTVSRLDISDTGCINKMKLESGGVEPKPTTGTTTPPTPTPTTNTNNNNIVVAPRPTPNTSPTTLANPNGSFKATAQPDIMMRSDQTDGVFQIDTSYNIRYGVLQSQTVSNMFDIWFILEPVSTLFSQTLGGSKVVLHFISPTTENPQTAINGNPINVDMAVQDPSGSSRQWKYSGVRIQPGMGMRFSFTYYLSQNINTPIDTQTIYYQASGVISSYTSVSSDGSSTVVTTTNVNNNNNNNNSGSSSNNPWDGKFHVDTSRCVQSDSCCCAIGDIITKPMSNGQIMVNSTLDGSSVCGGMTAVGGEFDLEGGNNAKYTYPSFPLTLEAELSADGNTISFKNSMYQCLSYANRVGPSSTTTTTTTNNGNGNNNANNNGNNNNNAGSNSQSQVLGDWESLTDKCVPSNSCCCLQGKMHIETLASAIKKGVQIDQTQYNINNANLVYGSANLDGGVACFRKTEIDGVCDLNYDTMSGICSMQGINFNATIINGQQLQVTNSMYKDCTSVATKVGGLGGGKNGTPNNANRVKVDLFGTLAMYLIVTLMFYFYSNW
jgi:hypothetical protein